MIIHFEPDAEEEAPVISFEPDEPVAAAAPVAAVVPEPSAVPTLQQVEQASPQPRGPRSPAEDSLADLGKVSAPQQAVTSASGVDVSRETLGELGGVLWEQANVPGSGLGEFIPKPQGPGPDLPGDSGLTKTIKAGQRVGAGVTRGALGFVEGMTSPFGLATLPMLAGASATVQKLAGAAFAAPMIKHAGDALSGAIEADSSGDMAQQLTEGILAAGMTGMIGLHAGGRGSRALRNAKLPATAAAVEKAVTKAPEAVNEPPAAPSGGAKFADDLTYRVVTPDTSGEGWRVTRLEKEDRTPVGHDTYPTREAAMENAAQGAVEYTGEIVDVPGNNARFGAIGSNPQPGALQAIREAQAARGEPVAPAPAPAAAEPLPFEPRQYTPAIKLADGTVVTGETHPAIAIKLREGGTAEQGARGYVTAEGEFVGSLLEVARREEAAKAAKAAAPAEVVDPVSAAPDATVTGIPATEGPRPVVEPIMESGKLDRSDGGFSEDPVISYLMENGGILSKAGAKEKFGAEKYRENAGEYEDAPTLSHPTHNKLFSRKGGLQADEAAQMLVRRGLLPENATVADMWARIGKVSERAQETRRLEIGAAKDAADRNRQRTAFEKDTSEMAEGDTLINADDLAVGDTVIVKGNRLEVTGLDPDTMDVTLGGADVYGEQVVPAGGNIVGKLEKAKVEEFGFGDDPPDAPAAAAPEPSPTGIRNAVTERKRAEQGLPPRMEPLRKTWGEAWEEAMALADKDRDAGRKLVDSVNANPRPLTDVENALLAHEQVMRETAFEEAIADVNRTAEGTAEKMDAKARLERAREDNQAIYAADELAGSEQGRGLASRKLMVDKDLTLAKMEAEWRAVVNDGKPLNEAQSAQVAKLHEELKATKEKLAESEKREASREARSVFDTLLDESKTDASQAVRRGQKIVDFVNEKADKARARIIARRGRLTVTVSPVNIAALVDEAIIGASYFAKGVRNAVEWSERMVGEFGERIRPALGALYERSRVLHEENERAFKWKPAKPKPKKKADTSKEPPAPAPPESASWKAEEAAPILPEQVLKSIKPGELDPKLVFDLARAHVNTGLRGMDDVMRAVHRDLEPSFKGLTEREVMDAFSGYGKLRLPSRAEDLTLLREYRSLARLTSQLEDAQAGMAPKKSGPQRDKASEKVRRLSKEVKETMRKMGIETTSPEQQLTTSLNAVKTRLRNDIEELDASIRDRKPRPSDGKSALEYDAEAKALKEQRDAKREEYDTIFGKAEMTAEDRVKVALRSVDRSIAAEDKMLRDGILKRAPRGSKTPLTPELEVKRAELRAMRDLRQELADAATPKRSAEDIQLGRDKKLIQKRIDELQRRVTAGDYSKRAKKEPLMDAEKGKLLFAYEKAREAYVKGLFEAQLKNRSTAKKVGDAVFEVANTSRAVMTSLDFSAVLRQGGFIAVSNPLRSANALPTMFKAFGLTPKSTLAAMKIAASELRGGRPISAALKAAKSIREFGELMEFESHREIQSRPNAAKYKQAKLFISDRGASLSKMEEAYMGRWAQKIPGVAGSARAYSTFLDRVRADSFDAMEASLARKGNATLEESRAIANFINVATGRASLPFNLDQAAVGLNAVFFAPRYVASRFQLLTGAPMGRGASPRVRGLIAKEYGKALTGLGVVYALAKAAGAELEFDSRSSDFGKIKIGNTRIDPLFGLGQTAVVLSRVISGSSKQMDGDIVPNRGEDVPFGTPDTAAVAGRFLRTKFSPVHGALWNIGTGKDVVGNKTTVEDTLLKLAIPMQFGDIADAMKEQGVPKGTAIALVSMFGASIQTFDPAAEREEPFKLFER